MTSGGLSIDVTATSDTGKDEVVIGGDWDVVAPVTGVQSAGATELPVTVPIGVRLGGGGQSVAGSTVSIYVHVVWMSPDLALSVGELPSGRSGVISDDPFSAGSFVIQTTCTL